MSEEADLAMEVFEDESMYNSMILLFLIIGIVVGVIIFLVGWLYFDYLWPSLFFGLLSGVVITFGASWKLQTAKDQHDALVKEFQHDAEEMGISTEQTQKMVGTFVDAMDRVTKLK